MSDLTCPLCGIHAISPMRKLLLGPTGKLRCRACSQSLRMASSAGVALVPLVAGTLAACLAQPLGLRLAWVGIGFGCMCYVHLFWVPMRANKAR